jgi:ABC-2 type transport system permease protein
LPGWLQVIAHCIPTSYVFEGMRAVLLQHVFRADLFFAGLAINVAFMACGIALYLLAIAYARKHGMLLQMGE